MRRDYIIPDKMKYSRQFDGHEKNTMQTGILFVVVLFNFQHSILYFYFKKKLEENELLNCTYTYAIV